jgi:hypothetical protein
VAFLHSPLNYWNQSADDWGYTSAGSDDYRSAQAAVEERFLRQGNFAVSVNSNRARMRRAGRIDEQTVTGNSDGLGIGTMFHLLKISRFFVGGCEILKQLADRNKYNFCASHMRGSRQTLNTKSHGLSCPELELSGSEAKFFLDRTSGRGNIDRKIFGDYFERAKFHLQAFGNLLNWRSCVLGWVGVSRYAHESARLRKAVSPKQGLKTLTNHQHQASGNKRLLGFFLFPADMEESDLKNEVESEERGRKGAWSYCVII